MADAAEKKVRTFKKYTFRGIELDNLLELPIDKLVPLLNARQRRKFARGIKHAPISFLKKIRASKKKCAYGEKPTPVKTHMRDLVILPEMVGAIVGVYTGKQFVNVEIKPDMIGNYLGEFALTYKPVGHGRAGNARFTP